MAGSNVCASGSRQEGAQAEAARHKKETSRTGLPHLGHVKDARRITCYCLDDCEGQEGVKGVIPRGARSSDWRCLIAFEAPLVRGSLAALDAEASVLALRLSETAEEFKGEDNTVGGVVERRGRAGRRIGAAESCERQEEEGGSEASRQRT